MIFPLRPTSISRGFSIATFDYQTVIKFLVHAKDSFIKKFGSYRVAGLP